MGTRSTRSGSKTSAKARSRSTSARRSRPGSREDDPDVEIGALAWDRLAVEQPQPVVGAGAEEVDGKQAPLSAEPLKSFLEGLLHFQSLLPRWPMRRPTGLAGPPALGGRWPSSRR
jgi:hypothetical protein